MRISGVKVPLELTIAEFVCRFIFSIFLASFLNCVIR
mgnify:CR=1 FL=1